MSNFLFGDLEKRMRLRKKLQRIHMQQLKDEQYFSATDILNQLLRIEKHQQHPKKETIELILDILDVDVDRSFYHYLKDQTTEAYLLRDQLLYNLDYAEDSVQAKDTAIVLIKQLTEMLGSNNQFIISSQARLEYLLGSEPNNIISLIIKGIAITYDNFDINSFDGEMLVFEEAELIHTLALTYARQDKLNEAIALLDKLQAGIEKLPEDERMKEKKLPKAMFTQSQLLYRVEDYVKALDICERGYNISLKRNQGQHVPGFVHTKALCLLQLGETSECRSLLQQAYFGYVMLHMKQKAEKVLTDANRLFGVYFNTKEVEALQYEYPAPFEPIIYGGSTACNSIGDLICQFRKQANLTPVEVYKGICLRAYYNKLENNEIQQPNLYVLEAIFQRLGRDINLYHTNFVSKLVFDSMQKRDEIMSRVISKDYNGATRLIAEFITDRELAEHNLNKQFILTTKASILFDKEGYSANYYELLIEAISVTIPSFNEREIDSYRLTCEEINIINQLACYYANRKDEQRRGVKIFEHLYDSINNAYIDETEKVRMYITVLHDYSKHLGLSKRYHECNDISIEGEALCRKYNRIVLLPGFAMNRAYSLFELGKKEESAPYAALAYYGMALVGLGYNQTLIRKYVEGHSIINLD